MKRILILAVALTGSAAAALSQDIIVLKNGDEIKAKVQEVGISDVKYKKFENTAGPAYTLLKTEIFMIKYENGAKDVFDAGSSSVENVTAAPAASQNGDAPPYAASARTWVFGAQTWSDAIHLPECNKTSFTNSYTAPQCRSYTSGGNTWYYYNWAFVLQNEPALCPAPWRVPTLADVRALKADESTLISQWGFGGYARGGVVKTAESAGYYWSAQQGAPDDAYRLKYHARNVSKYFGERKKIGMQVRCMR
jgi:hypothetical protein